MDFIIALAITLGFCLNVYGKEREDAHPNKKDR